MDEYIAFLRAELAKSETFTIRKACCNRYVLSKKILFKETGRNQYSGTTLLLSGVKSTWPDDMLL